MRGAKAALFLLLVSGAAAAPAPVMPHPAPLASAHGRVADNAACEGCHAEIAGEWRASLHHASFTDATIQQALPRDPEAFCTGCHAPESGTDGAAMGIGCVTCHVTGADRHAVLAGPGATTAPHPLLRSAEFAGDGACASCHEFDFPDTRLRRTPLSMQRTESEHRAVGSTDSCLACHMSRRGGHVDHRFGAARDPDFVRSAVHVEARRIGTDRVRVVLEPANVGHAFPTGDVFRRLRISAGSEQRFLARHFGSRQELPGKVVRVETGDDRVQGGAAIVELPVPATPTRVRVVYERAEGPSDRDRSTATVAGAIELFSADL